MQRLIAVSLWGALLLAGAATATGLPIAANSLGASTTSVLACDVNGVDLTYQLDSSQQLVSVTLRNISGGCSGGTARVTLLSGVNVVGAGTASMPTSGFSGSVVVTLGSTVAPAVVTRTAVAIDGI
jgi:hypothetical protein